MRADIARRKDADRFQYILDHFGKSAWSRRKDFRAWSSYHRREVDIRPSFRELSPREYEGLKPWVQKFFDERERCYRWGGVRYKYYVVNIQDYYLVLDKKRDYKTHYKVIDEILQQEEAELKARLDGEFYDERRARWDRHHSNKTWRKIYHRSERSKTRQAIKRNIMEAQEDEHYGEVVELGIGKGNRYWW